jgi:hypothetical protein
MDIIQKPGNSEEHFTLHTYFTDGYVDPRTVTYMVIKRKFIVAHLRVNKTVHPVSSRNTQL